MTIYVAQKTFTIRNPNNGRTYKFESGEMIKGARVKELLPRHVSDGWVIEFCKNTIDCSIQRRLEGRLFWHKQNQTDWMMDAECIALDLISKFYGTENLRGKGSGQTQIFSSVIKFIESNFSDVTKNEIVDGIDDVSANRLEEKRAIRWISDPKSSIAIASAIWNFLEAK